MLIGKFISAPVSDGLDTHFRLFLLSLSLTDSKAEGRRLYQSSSTKLLKDVLSLVGGRKTDSRRRHSVQSGCATWEAGLIEGGKL
jgi:hypothetical protein